MSRYRPHQFAEKVGVSVSTLRRWDNEGRLKAKRTAANQETLSPQEELVSDMLAIIHSFSSRLYGLRKYKKKLKSILEENTP